MERERRERERERERERDREREREIREIQRDGGRREITGFTNLKSLQNVVDFKSHDITSTLRSCLADENPMEWGWSGDVSGQCD